MKKQYVWRSRYIIDLDRVIIPCWHILKRHFITKFLCNSGILSLLQLSASCSSQFSERPSTEGITPIKLASEHFYGTFSHHWLPYVGPAQGGWCYPLLKGPGLCKKAIEQRPEQSNSSWWFCFLVLLRGSPLLLTTAPALTSLSGDLWSGKFVDPFPTLSHFWSWCLSQQQKED